MKTLRRFVSYLLIFILVGGAFMPSIKISAESKYLKINNSVLEFDEIIYVDEILGNDIIGNGSEIEPYKTLQTAIEKSIKTPEYTYAFKLGDGNYTQGKFIRNTDCIGKISVIGNGANTILTATEALCVNGNNSSDKAKCAINYYDLVWKDSSKNGLNKNCFNKPVSFNNIAFDFEFPDFSYSYFFSNQKDNTIQFNNCVVAQKTSSFLRGVTSGGINYNLNVINSYGGFSSGYRTTQAKWDIATNIITTTPQLDSEYEIIEEGWRNAGTGTNPDGTQAHIGVYGGEFAWNRNKSVGVPAGLIAIANNVSKNIDLSWKSVPGASSYSIKRSVISGGPYDVVATGSAITFTDPNVNEGITYYYVVSANKDDAESRNSNEASATLTAEIIKGNAILDITLDNGTVKEYNLTGDELNSFLTWYDNQSNGVGKAYYIFDVKGIVAPFKNVKNYIPYNKILCFDIKEYFE